MYERTLHRCHAELKTAKTKLWRFVSPNWHISFHEYVISASFDLINVYAQLSHFTNAALLVFVSVTCFQSLFGKHLCAHSLLRASGRPKFRCVCTVPTPGSDLKIRRQRDGRRTAPQRAHHGGGDYIWWRASGTAHHGLASLLALPYARSPHENRTPSCIDTLCATLITLRQICRGVVAEMRSCHATFALSSRSTASYISSRRRDTLPLPNSFYV